MEKYHGIDNGNGWYHERNGNSDGIMGGGRFGMWMEAGKTTLWK